MRSLNLSSKQASLAPLSSICNTVYVNLGPKARPDLADAFPGNSHVIPKHSSFQYLLSYTLVLMIFSTRYCGLVPLMDLASLAVRFAILFLFRAVQKRLNFAALGQKSEAPPLFAAPDLSYTRESVTA